jgi:hypothetical protein
VPDQRFLLHFFLLMLLVVEEETHTHYRCRLKFARWKKQPRRARISAARIRGLPEHICYGWQNMSSTSLSNSLLPAAV